MASEVGKLKQSYEDLLGDTPDKVRFGFLVGIQVLFQIALNLEQINHSLKVISGKGVKE